MKFHVVCTFQVNLLIQQPFAEERKWPQTNKWKEVTKQNGYDTFLHIGIMYELMKKHFFCSCLKNELKICDVYFYANWIQSVLVMGQIIHRV